MSNEWATEDNELPYVPNLHIKGTIPRSKDGKIILEFWLSRPRPKGVNIDEWDRLEQEKWERIFGKKEVIMKNKPERKDVIINVPKPMEVKIKGGK